MNFRSYVWLAVVVFLLGLAVLHQGWNHVSLDQNSAQMKCGSPAASSTDKCMNNTGINSQTGTNKGMNNMGGSGQK
ncbi:MAG: hypothetical protein ABSC17_03770 [Thermacetogeniaceae bacterium]